MPEHAKVYLDQNIYGHMLDAHTPWQKGAMAKVLLDAQSSQKAMVWAGTSNAVEALQASDPARRRALAAIMLDLIGSRRMWHGYAFEVVWEFMQLLDATLPQSIRCPQYFHFHSQATVRDYLGILGLLVATGSVNEDIVSEIKRDKLSNMLAHARFAADPSQWIESMLLFVEGKSMSAPDPWAGIDKLTIEEIEKEIEVQSQSIQKLGKKNQEKLNKQRGNIARVYGTHEIGACLDSVLPLPHELDIVFHIPWLVAHWNEIMGALGTGPLPKDIIEAGPEGVLDIPGSVVRVLQHAIYASGNATPTGGLYVPTLAYQVILREMQQSFNDLKLPTGGLTFDADHAAALLRFDILVCRDVAFAENCKTLAKQLEKWSKGKLLPEVVATPDQLHNAIEAVYKRKNSSGQA
jgi:hypothetical protein